MWLVKTIDFAARAQRARCNAPAIPSRPPSVIGSALLLLPGGPVVWHAQLSILLAAGRRRLGILGRRAGSRRRALARQIPPAAPAGCPDPDDAHRRRGTPVGGGRVTRRAAVGSGADGARRGAGWSAG